MRGQSGKAKGGSKKSPSVSGSATEGENSEKDSKSPQKSPEEAVCEDAAKEVDGETAKPAEEDDSSKKMIEVHFETTFFCDLVSVSASI